MFEPDAIVTMPASASGAAPNVRLYSPNAPLLSLPATHTVPGSQGFTAIASRDPSPTCAVPDTETSKNVAPKSPERNTRPFAMAYVCPSAAMESPVMPDPGPKPPVVGTSLGPPPRMAPGANVTPASTLFLIRPLRRPTTTLEPVASAAIAVTSNDPDSVSSVAVVLPLNSLKRRPAAVPTYTVPSPPTATAVGEVSSLPAAYVSA